MLLGTCIFNRNLPGHVEFVVLATTENFKITENMVTEEDRWIRTLLQPFYVLWLQPTSSIGFEREPVEESRYCNIEKPLT